MQESRRQFIAALTAGVTGTLAGCGGSESTAPTDTETEAPVRTQTETQAPTQTETATAGEVETSEPVSEPEETSTVDEGLPSQQVRVAPDGGLSFFPTSFTLPLGGAVEWVWENGGHNVRPETTPSGADWSGTDGGDSTTYATGHSYTHQFVAPGEYEYYCAPHQSAGMTGSVTITG